MLIVSVLYGITVLSLCWWLCTKYFPNVVTEYSTKYEEEGTPPLVEAFSASVVAFLFCVALSAPLILALLGEGWSFNFASLLLYVPFLVAICWVDFRFKLIPDRLQWICLGIALLRVSVFLVTGDEEDPVFFALGIGLLVPAGLYLLGEAYRRLRGQDGMGFADIKMLAWMALDLGPGVITALVVASFVALAIQVPFLFFRGKSTREPFAFGPYLAIGFVLTYVHGLLGWSVLPFPPPFFLNN